MAEKIGQCLGWLDLCLTLRKDAKWYTSDGEKYADVKAQDFVAGLKYAADNKSETLYLVQKFIKGLDDYVNSETRISHQLALKAVDDHNIL